MSSNRIKLLEKDLKINHSNFINLCKNPREGMVSYQDAVSELEKLNA